MSDWNKFKKATAEFWKDPALDVTDALLDLPFPESFVVFDLDPTGCTDYRGIYRDDEIGIYLFRSHKGGSIGAHWHKFAERVVFIRGAGSLVINRQFEIPLKLSVEKSILIPAGALHQGGDFENEDDAPSLSLCIFYYTMTTQ